MTIIDLADYVIPLYDGDLEIAKACRMERLKDERLQRAVETIAFRLVDICQKVLS